MKTSKQLSSIMFLTMALAPLGLACGNNDTTNGANPSVPGPAGPGPAGGPVPTPPGQPPLPPPAPGMPPTQPPVSPPTGPVEVKSCAEVDCPKLFVETIAMCDVGPDPMCGGYVASEHPTVVVECYGNGVKTIWTTDGDRRQSWTVLKPDGATCYTLQVTPVTLDEDAWVFKSPTGEELGRAVRGKDGLFLTCSANRKVYDVTGLDCPGLVLWFRCRGDATCK